MLNGGLVESNNSRSCFRISQVDLIIVPFQHVFQVRYYREVWVLGQATNFIKLKEKGQDRFPFESFEIEKLLSIIKFRRDFLQISDSFLIYFEINRNVCALIGLVCFLW